MWDEAIANWEVPGTVEYGVYQRIAKPDTPLWRRHTRGRRFGSVRAALFAPQGARNVCLGLARYPRDRYSGSHELFLPYAATWLRGASHAFLVRASAPSPEVTIVRTSEVEALSTAGDEQTLNDILATIFGQGARTHGVRILAENERILTP